MKPVFTKEEIQKTIACLAKVLSKHFETKKVLVVGIMEGALFFLADLMRQLPENFTYCTIHLKSYVSDGNQGEPKLYDEKYLKDVLNKIEPDIIIIADEICDTGTTINYLKTTLQEIFGLQPVEIYTCALIVTKTGKDKVDFYGFEYTDDKWLYGYGMDLDEWRRNLDEIYSK